MFTARLYSDKLTVLGRKVIYHQLASDTELLFHVPACGVPDATAKSTSVILLRIGLLKVLLSVLLPVLSFEVKLMHMQSNDYHTL